MSDQHIRETHYEPHPHMPKHLSHHEERWHVGKEFPLPLIATLAIQTFAGVWWLSQLSSKMDFVVAEVATFRVERYTKEDARRDKEIMLGVIESRTSKNQDLERRIQVIEGYFQNYHSPKASQK